MQFERLLYFSLKCLKVPARFELPCKNRAASFAKPAGARRNTETKMVQLSIAPVYATMPSEFIRRTCGWNGGSIGIGTAIPIGMEYAFSIL